MEISNWHDKGEDCKKETIYIGESECELVYYPDILGETPEDLICTYGKTSIAHILMDDTYHHIFLNGNEDDSWFEVVTADSNDCEYSFSECIWDPIESEDDIVNLISFFSIEAA